mmetsp:Transcript_17942/g.45891  ORF Transcript_17942/g.45891 Transcript_17942/m.45891 type:complete len:217 (+) Transcript_17942:2-652(+)
MGLGSLVYADAIVQELAGAQELRLRQFAAPGTTAGGVLRRGGLGGGWRLIQGRHHPLPATGQQQQRQHMSNVERKNARSRFTRAREHGPPITVEFVLQQRHAPRMTQQQEQQGMLPNAPQHWQQERKLQQQPIPPSRLSPKPSPAPIVLPLNSPRRLQPHALDEIPGHVRQRHFAQEIDRVHWELGLAPAGPLSHTADAGLTTESLLKIGAPYKLP